MKRKKQIEGLRQKTTAQLKEEIAKMEQELVKIQIDQKMDKIKNVYQLGQKRRVLAMAKTILEERNLHA